MAAQAAAPSERAGADVILPYVTLQPDYDQAYVDVSQGTHSTDSIWLSAYAHNAPRASIHTKLLLTQDDARGRGSNGDKSGVSVTLDAATARNLNLGTDGSQGDFYLYTSDASQQAGPSKANRMSSSLILQQTKVRTPRRTLGPLVKGALGVTAFDASPTSNGLYVVGGADGQAHVGSLYEPSEQTNGDAAHGTEGISDIERLAQERMRQRERQQRLSSKTYLKGHVGDIRSAKFFPSGEVVLTTSSDFTANIFGVDGTKARTLTGHRRAVLCSAFVDRGQQVLTGSADGTTRIWDVGQGSQLGSLMSRRFSAVNTISLGRKSAQSDAQSDKLLITGLASGHIEAHDLSSRQVVFRTAPISFPSGPAPAASDAWEQNTTGGIEALDWDRDANLLVAGCNNGIVLAYDLRMLSSSVGSNTEAGRNVETDQDVLASWRRNGSCINDIMLASSSQSEVLVASADGTPYRAALETQGDDLFPRVVCEYTGWDVDSISSCGVDARGRTWFAGAEGKVRCYQ